MKDSSNLLRRSFLLAAVPAALVFASCGDDDSPAAPSQGRVLVSHAAASANVAVKALVNDAEVAQLTYGQSTTGYLNVATGSPTLKINVASSNQTVATQPITVATGQSYSVFAYAPTATTVGVLSLTDDLTAPAAGKAKIRLVHLGQGAPTPLKLSTTVAAVADIPGTETAFAAASSFVEILPGSYNIAVTSGSTSTTLTNVGDGSGAGTVANRAYEAGKIYTVLLRGVSGALIGQPLQPKAVIIQNN